MNNRFREVRKIKNLTLKQVGDILGISESSVSNIERGRNNPSGSTLTLFCDKLEVNRHWLETGEGEMFDAEAEAPLNDYPPIIRAILRSYNRLNPAEQAAFCKFLDGVVEEYESTGQVTVDPFAAAEAAASDPAQSHTG